MRAIVQRVMKACVTVDDDLVNSIGRGLCVLVGISKEDTKKEIEFMVRKILNLRVFDGEDQKRWMKSVKDKNYEILCISQFTLCCTLKGNKPDYHLAMGADNSQQFYEEFLAALRKAYKPELIKDGEFGAYMQVNIQNDGPVTIPIDSPPPKQSPDKPRTPKTPVAVVKPEAKKKNITADHAVSFVDKVRSSFHGNPEFYEHFLDIMKEVRNQSIDTLTVIYRIGVLFTGKPELIHDFNLFLPSNYRLYIDSGDISKITVIIDGNCSMSLDALAEQIEKNTSTEESPSSESGAVGGDSSNNSSSEVDSILLNEALSRLEQQQQ